MDIVAKGSVGASCQYRLLFGKVGAFLPPGLIVAVTDDRLAADDPDKHPAVIHHRDKVLVHGGFDQLIHAGRDCYRFIIPLMGELSLIHI